VPTADRTALVVTTPAAASAADNGATLRAAEVVALLEQTGHRVTRTTARGLPHANGSFDLGVAVSYACAGTIRALARRADRVWLDAVDSWLLVNASGLRSGRGGYAARCLRDAWRLATMPAPDLVTWISGDDLRRDCRTVRGARRLVLPGTAPALPQLQSAAAGEPRRVVLAGDWAYPPNADGLHWFVVRVLPLMEEELPDGSWTADVYGTGAPAVPDERVRLVGYARDVRELYRERDVHVAPVRFGAGVKRKVLQPLLAGLPVVTTSAGAHGLRPNALLDVQDDPRRFAAAVAARLRSDVRPQPVQRAALLDHDDTPAVAAWLRERPTSLLG
jgi:glycosyltransferase involved in cell wall biosynthesis